MSNQAKDVADRLEYLAALERKEKLQEGLPFLHGWKFYPWAREFFESTNRENFLCAANQISKSSTQIRKAIDWATDQKKWGRLWRKKPLQFWYLYPSKDVATIEVEKKWIPEFLPRGDFKDHPEYGWRVEIKNKYVHALHFNSGVTIYFKTYAQDVQHLQTGTCDAIFCDEELPEELYDELKFRLAATDGYFHMVFTATLNQEIWRATMEERGSTREKFKDAFKLQVSMYDCLHYEDKTPSHWTVERIKRIEASCKSQAEVLRRVYGRFVSEEGLKYPAFDRSKNMTAKHPLPPSWSIYAGVDVGSGGSKGHPAAIIFVAVSPDCRKGRVFRGWRGDGIETTAGDVLSKFVELRGGLKPTAQVYDWASKDFGTIATRLGESFVPADKTHETGEAVINVLFKNNILGIQEDDPELDKLAVELSTLRHATPKTTAKDDMIDALRYVVMRIPWDWSVIKGDEVIADIDKGRNAKQRELDERRAAFFPDETEASIQDEFDAMNELYEA